MRMTNMLHFTENHRFCVNREFSLSSLDYKMLAIMYQPMIGGLAISLYQALYLQMSAEKVGYSPLEQQRKLFLLLELEQGERGRKYLIEQSSKLEAIGLLQTTRKFLPGEEDYVFVYTLFPPLGPNEFFRNQHLTLLLRDKVGKFMLLSLREELLSPEPEECCDASEENLSVPFYDLFRLNTQVVDYELEQALYEASASKQGDARMDVTTKGFQYADIIMRFPRGASNRVFVEALKHKTDQMAAINIVAKKYNLSLQETCRLLDEDGAFTEEGELQMDLMQYNANLFYRQSKKRDEERERTLSRSEEKSQGDANEDMLDTSGDKSVEMAYYLEVPQQLRGECTDHQYNYIMRNEPYTAVLKMFFTQGSIPDGVLNIFEKIDLNYKLNEEVINVLIHFLHIDRRSWAKSSIEAVASDMLGKQIVTYEQAVEYVREKISYKQKAASKVEAAKAGGGSVTRGRQGKTQKPHIPIVVPDAGTSAASRLTDEELEAARRMAQKLDERFNRKS
ncbi:replication initiation and membrane attachment protein [Paenibacillus sp. V4I3]|uniref:helicase DnaB n=1 Tax=unclassified Paenibacillus TaxID=185978 RepID=UPI002782D930|nr:MULTISPECIES: helicase DnaB [unclassified Paenibacillus]MDQ0878220.1 replication initiation and membrane attachment protein [Paenibacillus sp. V4I3]MDQ0885953.1 replication initiation and membrane attachment protein [Paenibacillus sp. V4I9]